MNRKVYVVSYNDHEGEIFAVCATYEDVLHFIDQLEFNPKITGKEFDVIHQRGLEYTRLNDEWNRLHWNRIHPDCGNEEDKRIKARMDELRELGTYSFYYLEEIDFWEGA